MKKRTRINANVERSAYRFCDVADLMYLSQRHEFSNLNYLHLIPTRPSAGKTWGEAGAPKTTALPNDTPALVRGYPMIARSRKVIPTPA